MPMTLERHWIARKTRSSSERHLVRPTLELGSSTSVQKSVENRLRSTTSTPVDKSTAAC